MPTKNKTARLGLPQWEADETISFLQDINPAFANIDANVADIKNISNDNFVYNSNFAINQRGQLEYTTATQYTVDRWENTTSNGKITVLSNGIKLSVINGSIQGPACILQRFDSDSDKMISGRTITASIKVVQINAVGARIALSYIINGERVYLAKRYTTNGIHSLTTSVPVGATSFYFQIYGADVRNGDIGGSCSQIEYVKLELGSVATPYTPPDPVISLMQCQKYHINLKGIYGIIASGFAGTSTTLFFIIPLPAVGMVGRGTIDAKNMYVISQGKIGTSSNIIPLDATFDVLRNDNSISGSVTSPQFNFTAGEPVLFQLRGTESYFDFDNEIY